MEKNIVIGAGISGLGAAHACRLHSNGVDNSEVIVLEKDADYGGLCGNIVIDGFRFDRFVHFSFAKEPEVLNIFNKSAGDIITHIPNPYNIYNRKWIKHPAQNNLFPLDEAEKKRIIDDFLARPTEVDMTKVENYEQWLRLQFGDYFAEHFPMVYTRKYWMCEAREMETKWVGNRVYQPSVAEVIKGAKTADTPVTYYAKEMRYPRTGGFKHFFSDLAEEADIRYNQKVVRIDTAKKQVHTEDGNVYDYENLYSSIPLPEYVHLVSGIPEEVLAAMKQLKCTSGYHVSVALKTKNIPPYLWWYIYDEDIPAARVYSPSLKSPENAPEGCSSLQLEVYCKEGQYTKEQLLAGTVGKLTELNIINENDILFTHIGFEKYANVIFDHNSYTARATVRQYLQSKGITPIGRFGEWGYLWSNQSLLSGMNAIK